MIREKTLNEAQRFRSYFHGFTNGKACVTGEISSVYNSVSWSLGYNDRWLWPGSNIASFDRFYRFFGYERGIEGTIALWGQNSHQVTHASVQILHSEGLWETKCGADLRVRHKIKDLAGGDFGKVIAFYSPLEYGGLLREPLSAMVPKQSSEREAFFALNEEISRVPKKLMNAFKKKYEAWQNTWFAGKLAINSDPLARTNCYEFFTLLKMGEKILPLIVEKLTMPEHFIALQLYERLQKNTEMLASVWHVECRGEQERAARTVSLYLKKTGGVFSIQ